MGPKARECAESCLLNALLALPSPQQDPFAKSHRSEGACFSDGGDCRLCELQVPMGHSQDTGWDRGKSGAGIQQDNEKLTLRDFCHLECPMMQAIDRPPLRCFWRVSQPQNAVSKATKRIENLSMEKTVPQTQGLGRTMVRGNWATLYGA